MKKIKIFRAIGAALAGVSLFVAAGCSNLFENIKDSDSSSYETSQKGRLLFSAATSARAASTVNPKGFDFANDSGLVFTLTGTLDSEKSTLGTWSDTDSTKSYAAMSADTSILVDTGDWTFRLSVTKDGSEVLYGEKSLTVSAGDNPLDFGELSEATGDDAADGNVSFTLSFPLNAAKGAAATFTSVETETAGEETSLEITSTAEKSSVTFTKSADAGSYILAIKLYSDATTKDSATYLNTYTALVNVAPGQASEGSAELTDLNALYTITYELNGGSFEEGTATSLTYNNHAKVTLPTPTRTGYTFAGWSKTSADATTADYSVGAQITLSSDTTLYALWTATEYTITYVLNLSDSTSVTNSNATTYTVAEDVTLANLTLDDYAFVGWYEDSDLTTKITGWSAGEKTGDVTFYAKWDIKATADDISGKIRAMTVSGTIKASGEFSSETLQKINNALKLLAKLDGRSGVLVTLDLSKVTGITKLSEDTVLEGPYYNFNGCTNLANVVLPNTITTIGEYAFSGCTSLTSITIPDSVTEIEEDAFSGCKNLTSITIPDSVKSIGNSAFSVCSSLASVSIGSGVTSIGVFAFYECTSLTSITIPDDVESIGIGTFEYCSSLEELTIPFVGSSATATAASEKTLFGYLFGTSLIGGTETTQNYSDSGSSTYYIPSSLKKVTVTGGNILYGAFSNCSNLETIVLPDEISSIGASALTGCSSLKTLVIPDGVSSIGASAFSGCSSLKTLVIPDGVSTIGANALTGCSSLEELTIPFVGSSASATTASSETLFGYLFGTTEYTGGIAVEQKYSAKNSTTYSIPDTLKKVTVTGGNILYGAFCNCSGLTDITIPKNITSIGAYAFNNCSGLTDITISENITSIGAYAFNNCSGLTSITIPEEITSINEGTFKDCSGFTSIIIPDKVKSIGKDAFSGCKALTSITIPENVTTIGESAFYYCTAFTSITIPDNVRTIGDYAFSTCSSVTAVTIGSGVTKIGYSALDCGTGLKWDITFKDTETWYYTKNSSYKSGTKIDVTNSRTNTKNLALNYRLYYWYKE